MDAPNPRRFEVTPFIPSNSGSLPDTPEYAAIKAGRLLAVQRPDTGSVRLARYRSPTYRTTRFAVILDETVGKKRWLVVSYAVFQDAKNDYLAFAGQLGARVEARDVREDVELPGRVVG